jgi:4-carboxymuconolactone decarboxylase
MRKMIITLLAACQMATVVAEQRLPTIPPEQYTSEQKQAAEEFLKARKREVFGPFEPLMYSPEVMSVARSMGDYLRYRSAIGNTLSEFAILITAREWTQDYEWFIHYPIALQAGIKKEVADAIKDGRRPEGMTSDEEMIYDFSTELHRYKRVSDQSFKRVEQRFGKKGVVDLAGINAYYTLLAMEMNTAQYPIPKDAEKLKRFPE